MIFATAVWLRLQSYATATETEFRQPPMPAPSVEAAGNGMEGAEVVNLTTDGQPVNGTTTAGAMRTSSQMASREQRYRELLQAPPPPAPPAREKPSFLDRMVSPIANALGIERAKPAPQVARDQQPTPRQQRAAEQRQQQEEQQQQDSKTASNADRGKTEEPIDDGESDIVPPQLLMADFNPPEVHDGESTTFGAMINDNRSGVRSVSGVIVSPSGSLQGFAATREGETNRFVARVNIPKEAPAGTWAVKYLTLTDNASNSINLNSSQGGLPSTTMFKVISAQSDASGPKLEGIWVEKPAMRAGEKNTVFVQAEDEQAGVSQVSGTFVSPSKHARIGFGCRLGSTGAWECPMNPPNCLDCGIWKLEQIQLQDKANNLTTFRPDNPIVAGVAVNIAADTCDAAPPVITALTVDPPRVSNAQPSVVTVRAIASDEGGCGVASLNGQAVPPGGVGGQRRPLLFKPAGDGQTFIGTIEIPALAAKGEWTLTWVQALDRGHNMRSYSSSDRVVAGATFTVD